MLSTALSKIIRYLNEVRFEVKKIVWPKKDELIGSTIIVCILVAVFAVILGSMDASFELLIRKFIVG